MLQTTFKIEGIVKATTEHDPTKERTATEVWKMLRLIKQPVLLWNAFPYHPHNPDEPLSNRRHTTKEFASCRHILTDLITWLKPNVIVALGADAETALTNVGQSCHRVRHPSYGGQADFARGISEIYGQKCSPDCIL